MEPITYANGSTLDDPALTYGIVFSNFMSKGVYTFQGGTDDLIKQMKKEMLSNGVDIRTHCMVEKFMWKIKRCAAFASTARTSPATPCFQIPIS